MCQNKRPGRRGKLARQHRSGDFTHFSLFTGIGGIDLAAEWAGFTTVGQCELADYPTKVLEKHWPGVPRWRDIRDVTAESVRAAGITNITVLSGGFPCQPFSVAGKQKGKEDNRYLWPEMLRVIRELAPRWVVAENVPGILRIAGRTVCEDLEREGYAVTVFNYEAAAVGAPHRRERVFFVADTNRDGTQRDKSENWQRCGVEQGSKNVAIPRGERETERGNEGFQQTASLKGTGINNGRRTQKYVSGERRAVESDVGGVASRLPCWLDGYWRVEPNIPRVATGVKNRVDRLKCLGNAVVPQQVYPILQAIAEIESG